MFRLFWELSKLFTDKFGDLLPRYSNTSQLIWRDYFYTMSIESEKFDQMVQKPTTVAISWKKIETKENRIMLECWKNGKTGYPFIDAGMRQLIRVSKKLSSYTFNNIQLIPSISFHLNGFF